MIHVNIVKNYILIVYVVNKNGFVFYIISFYLNIMPVFLGDWIPMCKYDVLLEKWIFCPKRNKQILENRHIIYNITGDLDDCLDWVKYKQNIIDPSANQFKYVLVDNDLFNPKQNSSLFHPRCKKNITEIVINNKHIEVHTLE